MLFPYSIIYGAALMITQINAVICLNTFFNRGVIASRSWSFPKLVIGTFNVVIGIEQVASLCAFFFSRYCGPMFWAIRSIAASPPVHLMQALFLAAILHEYHKRSGFDDADKFLYNLAFGTAISPALVYGIYMAYHQSLIRAMSLVFYLIFLAFAISKYRVPIVNMPLPPGNDVSRPFFSEEPDSYFPQTTALPRISHTSNPDTLRLNKERRTPALGGTPLVLGSDSAGIKMHWAILNVVLNLIFENILTWSTSHMNITSTCTKDWMAMSTLLIIRNTASATILFAATESGPFCRATGKSKALSLWVQMIFLEWSFLSQNRERRDLDLMGLRVLMASTVFMMIALGSSRNMRWLAGMSFLMFLVTSFASKIYMILQGGTLALAAAESQKRVILL